MLSSTATLLSGMNLPSGSNSSPAIQTGMNTNTGLLTERAPSPGVENQDRRQLFIGNWNCTGTQSMQGQVRSFDAHMHNLWALDNTWLLFRFQEYKAQGQALAEDQYWGFEPTLGRQVRPIMTNGNGYGFVTAHDWEGDILNWTGTYTPGATTFDVTEKIVILAQNQIQWSGEILFNGVVVGGYDLLCTRQH